LKSLESLSGKVWEAVFILALNQGIFPGKMASDLEKERKLFYVAATRASRYLFLLTREKDFRWGAPVLTGPSLFLQELGVDFDNNILYEME